MRNLVHRVVPDLPWESSGTSKSLVRLIDTPQFWEWFFYGGYIGPSAEEAMKFYHFYSRPETTRLSSFEKELSLYSFWYRYCVHST